MMASVRPGAGQFDVKLTIFPCRYLYPKTVQGKRAGTVHNLDVPIALAQRGT
jgi:hypothetical protein